MYLASEDYFAFALVEAPLAGFLAALEGAFSVLAVFLPFSPILVFFSLLLRRPVRGIRTGPRFSASGFSSPRKNRPSRSGGPVQSDGAKSRAEHRERLRAAPAVSM